MIEWLWGLLPWQAQWGIVGCLALFVVGVIWRFKDALAAVKKIAGWPGVAAAIGIVTIIASVIWGWFSGKKPPAEVESKRWPPIGRTAKRSPTPSKKRYLDENGYWRDL